MASLQTASRMGPSLAQIPTIPRRIAASRHEQDYWSRTYRLSSCLFVWAVFVNLFPIYHIRYRLVVNVSVDGVIRTGSGVVDISYRILPDHLAFAGSGVFRGILRGYAITVDLKERGQIYIVDETPMLADRTNGGYLTSLPLIAFGFQPEGRPSVMKGILREMEKKIGSVVIPAEELPMIVRFRIGDDINSMEELDPDHLEEALGSGVRFESATLEITDDPISPVPQNYPAWLADSKFQNAELHGRLYMPVSLSYLVFKGE